MLQIEASRVSHARELTFDEIHACVRAHGCTLLENPGSEKPHKNVLYTHSSGISLIEEGWSITRCSALSPDRVLSS